jgi:hypothetical protein
MTKDEIIEMARQAGFGNYTFEALSMFERFAALVASAEREACAKIGDDHPSWSSRMYSATIRARGEA